MSVNLASSHRPPRILYALLAGTWSDQHGRKLLLVLPIVGQLLACLSYGLNYAFLTSLPWQLLFLELVNDLCGSYVAYYLAQYSYITDITLSSQRTFRLSVIDGLDYGSTSIGTLIAAPLFLHFGYYAVFGGSAGCCLLGLLYLSCFVKESLGMKTEDSAQEDMPLQPAAENVSGYGSQADVVQTTQEDESTNWFWFSINFVFNSFRTVFKSRRGPRRAILLLGVLNFALYIFTYNGTEGTHRYAFAQRKYGWSEQEMSTYLFDYRLAYLIATWFLVPLLSKVLGLADTSLAILSSTMSAIGFFLPAFTDGGVKPENTTVWWRSGTFVFNWFSLSSFVCMMSPITTIATRSIISSVVPSSEIGRIYSVLALFSAASGSLVEAGYQLLYSTTISSFLGSYLLLNSSFYLFTIPVNCVISWLMKRMEV